MNLVELRKEISAMPLSYDHFKAAGEILDAAIQRGALTPAEKEQLTQLLKLEEKAAEAEITATEDFVEGESDRV